MGEGKKDVVIFTSAKEKLHLASTSVLLCARATEDFPPVHLSVAPDTWLYHSCYHHQASGMQTDTVIHCLNIILTPHWTVSSGEISDSFPIFMTSSTLLSAICGMMVIPHFYSCHSRWVKGSVLHCRTTTFMMWETGVAHSSYYSTCTQWRQYFSYLMEWWKNSHHHCQATSRKPGPWKRGRRKGKEKC